ncbi:MAG: hypothetical protein EBU31_16460, partial [Proteobacteria bacterium]|nr:hypothetical protein [Pseudomonadota bacterium]
MRDFKAEVERLAATGKYGNVAVDQLRQSVATLELTESRVHDALTAVASGKRGLANARSAGDRSSLSNAAAARDQSAAILSAAAALRGAVANNAREIERVRLDGYVEVADAAAEDVRVAATALQGDGDALVSAASGVLAASNERNARIGDVTGNRDALVSAWSGGPSSASSRLQAFATG